MNLKTFLPIAFAWSGLSFAFAGDLTFSQKIIEVQAKPDQKRVEVDFKFECSGDSAAEIKNLNVACSCLEAQLSNDGRLLWEPGQEGYIRGIFEVGTFKGTVPKEISVIMKDGSRHDLTVRLQAPESLKIEPRTLKWTENSPAEKQAFTLTVNEEYPLNVVGVSGTNEEKFPLELETVEEGKTYKIWVTPTETKIKGFGRVRVTTDSSYKNHQVYDAYTAVTRKEIGKKPSKK